LPAYLNSQFVTYSKENALEPTFMIKQEPWLEVNMNDRTAIRMPFLHHNQLEHNFLYLFRK